MTDGSGRPSLLVAETTQQSIVLLNPTTGRVIRTVYRPPGKPSKPSLWRNWDPGDGGGLAVSPDGSTAYFEAHDTFLRDGTPTATIERVSLDGSGAATPVVKGFEPELSPDGTQLAYGTYLDGSNDGPGQILVDDLATGTSRVVAVAAPGTEDDIQVTKMSWAPDGRHLAVSMFAPGCQTVSLSVIDTATQTTLEPPEGPTILGATTTFYWWAPTYMPDGGLFVGQAPYLSDCSKRPAPESLVTLAPNSASVTRVVATGPEDSLGATSVDASGQHLLFVQETATGPNLMESDDGKAPTLLAPNILYAIW